MNQGYKLCAQRYTHEGSVQHFSQVQTGNNPKVLQHQNGQMNVVCSYNGTLISNVWTLNTLHPKTGVNLKDVTWCDKKPGTKEYAPCVQEKRLHGVRPQHQCSYWGRRDGLVRRALGVLVAIYFFIWVVVQGYRLMQFSLCMSNKSKSDHKTIDYRNKLQRNMFHLFGRGSKFLKIRKLHDCFKHIISLYQAIQANIMKNLDIKMGKEDKKMPIMKSKQIIFNNPEISE